MSDNGDWYCRNCGYLSSSRVTFSETCDTCHTPVEWYEVNQISTLDTALEQIESLKNQNKEQKELLDKCEEALKSCWITAGKLEQFYDEQLVNKTLAALQAAKEKELKL